MKRIVCLTLCGLAVLFFAQFNEQLKILGKDNRPQADNSADALQESEAFAEQIKKKGLKQTGSEINIEPRVARIIARPLDYGNRKVPVLSVQMRITNYAAQPITMNLAHEWGGGIWAPTDFYVAAKVSMTDDQSKMIWSDRPAYQVGNLDKSNETTLRPGDSITVDVRLNWHGTGSVPIQPLIDESVSNSYTLKFLLFFKTDTAEEYVLSPDFKVDVEKYGN